MESFKPISNTPPEGFFRTIKFYLRLFLDFQVNTVYKSLRDALQNCNGNVLDVGCGESPYRYLINESKAKYTGLDTYDSGDFGYNNPSIIKFDGSYIPLDSESTDLLFCTEVLEHVIDPKILINEMYRVLKPGSLAIITLPWSARFHYIPYDYHRYTPSMLKILFHDFTNIEIKERGTDVTNIIAKMLIIYFRNLIPVKKWRFIFAPVLVVFFPFVICLALVGHLSLMFDIGSKDDPLGYTIYLKK